MSEHKINIRWKNNQSTFEYDHYDRSHEISFEGGQVLKASSAPQYLGDASLSNPEEMLAASLASCHMLTFLAIAAKSKLIVQSYEDHAVAHLGKNAQGKLCVIKITLNPKVNFLSSSPDMDKLKNLHEKAHANCFIANSIQCEFELKLESV